MLLFPFHVFTHYFHEFISELKYKACAYNGHASTTAVGI